MKNIAFPEHWESPKYRLGQRVQQGEIIGIEYNPPGTRRAYELGDGWSYTVMIDQLEDDVETCTEEVILLASVKELLSEIEFHSSQIKIHQDNITVLNSQLGEVEQ